MKIIKTKRLILRKFAEKDFNDFYEYGKDKKVGPNAGWAPHESREESKEIFKQFCESEEVFAIELKDEKKVIVSLITDTDEVSIQVKDNGVGIEESELDKIFNKFYRIDTSLTYEVEGTGLGLAICREIIQEHGKEITVESTPGEGSVFKFTLDKSEG